MTLTNYEGRMNKTKTGNSATPKLGPSAIARRAGISKQLASRKLKQGKTPAEIVEEANHRRAVQAAKTKTRRHTPPFTESQAKKEAALAALREHELGVKRGGFWPAQVVDRFVKETIMRVRDRFIRLPNELRDALDRRPGLEIEAILTREIEVILQDLGRMETWRRRAK